MRLAARLVLAAACVGVAVGLSGCDDGRKRVYTVRGKVTDTAGKPLAGATIVLHPVGEADPKVPKPAGLADEEGRFVLTTYKHNDGAPAGEYVATVEWRAIQKDAGDDPPDQLNGKYSDPKSSPFKVTVTKGDNDLPKIEVP